MMGDTNHGGRPKKPVKKEWRITIRLTEAERYILKGKAREAGTNLANYIRAAAIKGKVVALPQVKDHAFFRQAIGISTNLNQVARAVNKQGILPLYTKLKEIIGFFDEQMKQVQNDQQGN